MVVWDLRKAIGYSAIDIGLSDLDAMSDEFRHLLVQIWNRELTISQLAGFGV